MADEQLDPTDSNDVTHLDASSAGMPEPPEPEPTAPAPAPETTVAVGAQEPAAPGPPVEEPAAEPVDTEPETPPEAPDAPALDPEGSDAPAVPLDTEPQGAAVPVVVDNATRRSGDNALEGHFVDVIDGPHKGLFGVFLSVVHWAQDGFPTHILVRNRDHASDVGYATVEYDHARPSDRTGGR